MGNTLPEGLNFWTIDSQVWNSKRHVNKFYIGHRGLKMWFINIPHYKYITIYKTDTRKK